MKPYRFTVHCSDTKNGEPCPASEIKKWHIEKGWSDIGYHMVIQPNGTKENGRSLTEQGAHVEGENEGNIGICLVGRDKFTKEQFISLRSFIDDVSMIYDIRPWKIYCHNEFESARKQGKTCPNMDSHNITSWFIGHYEEAVWPYLLERQ